ncbi:MAG TPA: SlyX family protein [Bacteriovoracaceae bacterium]|nr:SlyX family protein [Bacteriovoracaceae bacterium]
MLENRIIALEEKFSHQDYLLEQLNKTVTDQQLIIDQLKKDVLALQLSQNANANQGTRSLSDDIPPHY